MSNRLWAIVLCGLGLTGVPTMLWMRGVYLFAQTAAAAQAKPPEAKVAAASPYAPAPAPGEKAWGILRDALKNENADKRSKVVRSLGLLPGNGGRLYRSLGRCTRKDQRKGSRLTLSSFPKDAAVLFA